MGSPTEAASGADAVVVATEWPEFAEVALDEVAAVMQGSVIVDARNLLDPERVVAAGLRYEGVGRRLDARPERPIQVTRQAVILAGGKGTADVAPHRGPSQGPAPGGRIAVSRDAASLACPRPV